MRFRMGHATVGRFQFLNNANTEVFTIDARNEKVGIGTTSPTGRLDINYTGTGGTGILGIGEGLNITSLSPNITFNDTSTGMDDYAIHLNQSVFTLGRYTSSTTMNPDLVLKSGNVGIGTTIPGKLLEVKSSIAYNSTVRLSTTVHNWDIQGGETGYSSTAFALDYDGTTFFRAMGTTDARFSGGLSVGTVNATPPTGGLYVAGNVGIGTTSPNQKLDVNGNISIATTSGSSASNQISMVGSRAIFGYDGSISSAFMRSSDTSKPLVFGSGTSELMRIVSSTGNVGIGTTSPAHKFEVHGLSSGAIGFNGSNVKIGNVSSIGYQRIFPTGNSLKYSVGTEGAHQFVYGVDNSTMMHISYSGKVGIGTTNPSQKLEVDGQVLSDGYRLAAMQTAPATRNSTGTLGEIVIDGNHIYVCYATDSWSRVALETSW
jgi:hypothetical protein